jgi:cell wall-associated NlpC family hydrolase
LVLTAAGAWAAARTAWVLPETANVRKSADTNSDVVTQVTKGEKFYVIKYADGWAGGKTASGKWGWIREDLLQFSPDKGRALAQESGHAAATAPGACCEVHHPPAWVAVGGANVRSGPGLGYDRYGTLGRGTKVYVLERRPGWLRCKTPGGSGWIADPVITYDRAIGNRVQEADPPKAYIDGEVVSLRKGPSADSDLVARVREGQTVWVLERHPDWAKVKVNNGMTGWVSRDYLKSAGSANSSTPPAPTTNFPSPTGRGKSSWGHFNTITAWVDADPANIRGGASSDADVSFQLAKGTKISVIGIEGQWCHIRTDEGKEGYLAGWLLNFSPEHPPTHVVGGHTEVATMGWVNRPLVNLRSGAGDNYPRTGTLTLSTQVIIVGQSGDWYKVALDNHEIGWVQTRLVDTEHALNNDSTGSTGGSSSALTRVRAAISAGASSVGNAILQTAMKYLGYSYVHGGASPEEGFDCSGLVSYCLHQHGIAAERTCPDLFRQGQPVSRDDLEPGDVVFFANTYRPGISHVGIYMGGDRFINAANPSRGVVVNSLDESYYASRYVGARRMR